MPPYSSFTGLPASNQYEPDPDLTTASQSLRDAVKNNRPTADYELEDKTKWDRPLAERIDGDFYGGHWP